jgi:lipoprotein NlpI
MADETERADEFMERAAPELPRPSVWYDMARFYLRPIYDGTILRSIQDTEDDLTATRMQFYLAGQYEALGQLNSARELYREVDESGLRGFAETRLARARYEALLDNR